MLERCVAIRTGLADQLAEAVDSRTVAESDPSRATNRASATEISLLAGALRDIDTVVHGQARPLPHRER